MIRCHSGKTYTIELPRETEQLTMEVPRQHGKRRRLEQLRAAREHLDTDSTNGELAVCCADCHAVLAVGPRTEVWATT